MNSTVALLLLIGIVGAIWWLVGAEGRGLGLWKLVYFILAVCTLIWLLDITGIWHGGGRIFGHGTMRYKGTDPAFVTFQAPEESPSVSGDVNIVLLSFRGDGIVERGDADTSLSDEYRLDSSCSAARLFAGETCAALVRQKWPDGALSDWQPARFAFTDRECGFVRDALPAVEF